MGRRATKGLFALVSALIAASCSAPDTNADGAQNGEIADPAYFDPAAIACSGAEPLPRLGLMTSLPIYWPLNDGFEEFARGEAELPWQRSAISQCYSLVPLDTLSPIPGLSPEEAETDPLRGLKQLAIVQPRGLSPSDNVALDDWVRAGGHLLLVLDPMLTGEYDLALGDPRRPVDSAAIPPVIKRWGMEITFNDEQELALHEAGLDAGHIWLSMPGKIALDRAKAGSCQLLLNDAMARCSVEEGRVTVLADAASFEHAPAEVENSRAKEPPLLNVLRFSFEEDLEVFKDGKAAP